jgi:crossover junction endodeoxyribonuclease RuvC
MRIVGIDLGLLYSGYGIVEKNGREFFCVDFGEICLPKKQAIGKRLSIFYEHIEKVIKENNPKELVIEELYLARNVKTAFALGQARGVTLLLAERLCLPFFSYTPLEVKKAVVGYGLAQKEQVRVMVKRLLNLDEISSQHATDALAVALCHLHHLRL